MKKISLVFFVLFFAVLLAGCYNNPVNSDGNGDGDTEIRLSLLANRSDSNSSNSERRLRLEPGEEVTIEPGIYNYVSLAGSEVNGEYPEEHNIRITEEDGDIEEFWTVMPGYSFDTEGRFIINGRVERGNGSESIRCTVIVSEKGTSDEDITAGNNPKINANGSQRVLVHLPDSRMTNSNFTDWMVTYSPYWNIVDLDQGTINQNHIWPWNSYHGTKTSMKYGEKSPRRYATSEGSKYDEGDNEFGFRNQDGRLVPLDTRVYLIESGYTYGDSILSFKFSGRTLYVAYRISALEDILEHPDAIPQYDVNDAGYKNMEIPDDGSGLGFFTLTEDEYMVGTSNSSLNKLMPKILNNYPSTDGKKTAFWSASRGEYVFRAIQSSNGTRRIEAP